MSSASYDLVGHTAIELTKLDPEEVSGSRRSTLTQREPPNPYKNKRKIVAIAAIVILGLTVWSCIAAYHVVKHLVWGPDITRDASRLGAVVQVPKPDPLLLSSLQWTAHGVESEGQEKRDVDSNHQSIACLIHAKRPRLQQVLAAATTWLPTCDYHALIHTGGGGVEKQLKSLPHISLPMPSLDPCLDRVAVHLSASLFPHADWLFLAPDDTFVMVDRLRLWLQTVPADAYPDLPTDGGLLVSSRVMSSLNLTECDPEAAEPVASLLKRNFTAFPAVDAQQRTIVMNKYKTANQHELSPLLSIVQRVTPAEMLLMHNVHSKQQ